MTPPPPNAAQLVTQSAGHATGRLAGPVRVERAGSCQLTLRWEIAAQAVPAHARPAPTSSAKPRLNGHASSAPGPYLMLEWTVPLDLEPGRPAQARAEMVDPATGDRLTLATVARAPDDLAGPVRITRDQDLRHIEIDGLLSATLRISAGHDGPAGPVLVQVLYARTSLLTQLGIAGGRYEPAH